MKKNPFNYRQACEEQAKIHARISELADVMEGENKRDLTEAEQAELKRLYHDDQVLDMKMRANMAIIEVNRREDIAEATRQMRECVKSNQLFELKIARGVDASFGGNTSGYADPAASTNPAGVTIGDIVEPLYGKLILSAIGSPLLTGLKGNYMWPVVEAFEATINDEGAELGDTKIDIKKLIAKPERIGVAVPVTREAINETDDIIPTICTQYMPTAVAALLNKIMFSSKAVSKATNLVGPFVNMKSANSKTYAGEAPTYKELLSLKSAVLSSGVMAEGLCYVMTETTKSLLEATPKWDGANDAIVVDDEIGGVPVFTTSYADEGDVLFGAFKYAPQGLFGDMTFIVDPYSKARKNAIDFVINAQYAITTLRQEAFAKLSKSGD